jgi:hypothetical protein
MSDIECSNTMFKFKTICKRLGVPIADDKTECPVTSMNYFGLTINNESMCVKIPEETTGNTISNTSWAYICQYNTCLLFRNQVNQSLQDSRAKVEMLT